MGESFGNPSSAHSGGERARKILREARASVAELVGALSEQIVFTSSGTESNNLALFSIARAGLAQGRTEILCSNIEHSSVLAMEKPLSAIGVELLQIACEPSGSIDPHRLAERMSPRTAGVSIQWINNETGVIHPLDHIQEVCHRHQVLLHTDAAQAVGKIEIDLDSSKIHYVSATGHKFHGPQGVGFLYAKRPSEIAPSLYGGPQEDGHRASTENVPGIAGLGVAAALRRQNLTAIRNRVRAFRDRFEAQILERIPEVIVNGAKEERIWNTSNLVFRGLDGQALVARLDQMGVQCSQSSACTSGKPEPSYVLRAMGLSEEDAYASLRFGFGELNSQDDVERAVDILEELCGQLRGFQSGVGKGLAAEENVSK